MLVFFHSCFAKKTIGAVAEVVLLPWGIHLPARIDTGAHTSSLFALDVVETNGFVSFRFPDKYGGKHVRLPLIEWRTIKSSDGIEEKRAVVDIIIKLGGRKHHTQVALDDRSRMSYPMLIGRRTLKGYFLVDVAKSRSAIPEPAEGGSE